MNGTPPSYPEVLLRHYEHSWGRTGVKREWRKGPVAELPQGFCVVEFGPGGGRDMWTYATCGMSAGIAGERIELHLFSPVQTEDHVELLTAVAHYHCTGARLRLGHSVNFGRPWLPGSRCSFGLVSLPYLDGPSLEVLPASTTEPEVQCLWLIPITARELQFKKERGLEALESRFQAAGIHYLDPHRPELADAP